MLLQGPPTTLDTFSRAVWYFSVWLFSNRLFTRNKPKLEAAGNPDNPIGYSLPVKANQCAESRFLKTEESLAALLSNTLCCPACQLAQILAVAVAGQCVT